MRCLEKLIYKDGNHHPIIRTEIVKYLENNKNKYENMGIETEKGVLKINDYINYIKNLKTWGGELEKYAAQNI